MASLYERITQKTENAEAREILPAPVYYVESSDDNSVLIGMNVAVEKNPDGTSLVTWHDTTRERAMIADEVKNEDDFFAFKRTDEEGGQFYKFSPMTLELYNEKVKAELIAGQDFGNPDEMTAAFLKTMR